MPPLILFANAAGQLREDPAGFLRIDWGSGPRSLQDTQALFGQMILALQRRGWNRILVNQQGMRPFTPAEQQWVAHEWLPRAVREGGYRHGAVLVSADVLVRLATAYVTTHVQGLPLVYRSFDSESEALRWLSQQPGTPPLAFAPALYGSFILNSRKGYCTKSWPLFHLGVRLIWAQVRYR